MPLLIVPIIITTIITIVTNGFYFNALYIPLAL